MPSTIKQVSVLGRLPSPGAAQESASSYANEFAGETMVLAQPRHWNGQGSRAGAHTLGSYGGGLRGVGAKGAMATHSA